MTRWQAPWKEVPRTKNNLAYMNRASKPVVVQDNIGNVREPTSSNIPKKVITYVVPKNLEEAEKRRDILILEIEQKRIESANTKNKTDKQKVKLTLAALEREVSFLRRWIAREVMNNNKGSLWKLLLDINNTLDSIKNSIMLPTSLEEEILEKQKEIDNVVPDWYRKK